jgi:NDP-sugar pyrophosphorylase family protein
MSISIVILAAAKLEDESDVGYPFYFAEKNGKTFIENMYDLFSDVGFDFCYFAFNSMDISKYHLHNFVKGINNRAKVVSVAEKNAGSAITALISICDIDEDSEVLFVSANEYVNVDIKEVIEGYRTRDLDAGVITFKSLHPRYSYVLADSDNSIIEISQQNPISDQATTGIFWWKNKKQLQKCLMQMILKGRQINDKFYVGMALNELILAGGKVGLTKINKENYTPIKTIAQLLESVK